MYGYIECDLMDWKTPRCVVLFLWNQMLKFKILKICNHDV
jgi:hypothetical protein